MTLPTTRDLAPGKITTIGELHDYLYRGLQLEHATIPVYLTALYSLHPESNSDAWHILRVVAIEEMLHLTLAANVMNAVGGEPDLTKKGFVPTYPTRLPDGETDFLVDLQPFSEQAIDTFLQIERPSKAPEKSKRIVPRSRAHEPAALQAGQRPPIIGPLLATVPGQPEAAVLQHRRVLRGDRPRHHATSSRSTASRARRCSPAIPRARSRPSTTTPAAARSSR